MSVPLDSRAQLLRVVVELARELPPGVLNGLMSLLECGGGGQTLDRFAATQAMRDRLRRFEQLCTLQPEVTPQAIALALQAAAEAASTVGAEHRTDIAWTGPATEAVSVRRVDQVLYELVESANEEVLVATYAAYKAERALAAMQRAVQRGVNVRLVLELARDGGKITFDGLKAIRAVVPQAAIYYWPLEKRPPTQSGGHGAMHVKCVIADRRSALVSSANLTDYALESNMELGLHVEGAVANRLAVHFDQLIVRQELARVPE